MTVNMEIGMITPPVGLNLYVASGISAWADRDHEGLRTVDPGDDRVPAPDHLRTIISLWLPNLLMGAS